MEEQEISIADEIAEIGKLLSDPERWTAENVAESKKRASCKPCASRAVRWSVAGAVAKQCNWDLDEDYAGSRDFAAIYGHISLTAHRLYKKTVEQVEREMGHQGMLTMLRHAYRTAKAAENASRASQERLGV